MSDVVDVAATATAAASATFDRQTMKARLFLVLDSDSDGRLGCADMRRFAELIGFDSDAAAWREEFEALCAGRGNSADEGLSESDFMDMLDDDESDNGLFCSDKYLRKAYTELTQPKEVDTMDPNLMTMANMALQLRVLAADADERVEAQSSELAAHLRAQATLANDAAQFLGAAPPTSGAKITGHGRQFYKQVLMQARCHQPDEEISTGTDSTSDDEEGVTVNAADAEPSDNESSENGSTDSDTDEGEVAVSKAAQIASKFCPPTEQEKVREPTRDTEEQAARAKRRRLDDSRAGQGSLQDELIQLGDIKVMRDKSAIPRLARKIAHVFLPVDGTEGVLYAMGDVVTNPKVSRPVKLAVIYVLHELFMPMKIEQREAFVRESVNNVLIPVGPFVARLPPDRQASWLRMLNLWSTKNVLSESYTLKLRSLWTGKAF
eukprot:TRINITY_DN63753_c0_g1_i1.p1 TRINITY_DN63753_c0_g1~~TRINITY_DN63753_c0_g1_i1.p1  ORF type:complete len:436 (+),score=90.93 TRINITY_DN63753_c0_g1_i1:292-1599(+)